MSDENETRSPSQVVGDEERAERVHAEDAKLDAAATSMAAELGESATVAAEAASTNAQAKEERHIDVDQLPPASFTMLVQMFATQAMVALGVIPSPEGKQIQQLPLAKHFIDLLGVLEEKCHGNLGVDEKKLLEQSVYELRMVYVQLSSNVAKK